MMNFTEWLAHLHFSDTKSAQGMLSHLGILYFVVFLFLLAKTENQCHTTLLVQGFL